MGVGRNGELRCTCLTKAAVGRKRRSNVDAREGIKAARDQAARDRMAAASTSASGASSPGVPMEP